MHFFYCIFFFPNVMYSLHDQLISLFHCQPIAGVCVISDTTLHSYNLIYSACLHDNIHFLLLKPELFLFCIIHQPILLSMSKWLMKTLSKISPKTKPWEAHLAATYWYFCLQQDPLPSHFEPAHYLFQNLCAISTFFILTNCFICDIMSNAFWKPDKWVLLQFFFFFFLFKANLLPCQGKI